MFYMTREHESRFTEFVRTTGDIIILPTSSPTEDFVDVSSLPAYFEGDEWLAFYIWNRDVSSRLIKRPVPTLGTWSIDTDGSSVIEFLRSHPKHGAQKTLEWGRLWAEFTYLSDDKRELIRKEPEFERWYETLAKWVRRSYKRESWNTFAAPGAMGLVEEGWKLV